MRRILLFTLLAATLAACSSGTPKAAPTTTTPPKVELVAALQSTDSCPALLDWIHTQADSRVGPYGLDSSGVAVPETFAAEGQVDDRALAEPPVAESTMAPASSAASSDAGAGSGTGTNDQEAGVDEPDQFKSDGHRAVMTDGQRLMSIDVSSATPTLLGEVDLPMSGARLFLRGDHVLAVGSANASDPAAQTGMVELADIDLSAGAPKITSQASVDGQLVDGRLAGGTVRLVVSTPEPTRVSFVTPTGSDGSGGTARAVSENRAAIDRSTIAQWIPTWTPPDGVPTPLLDCSSVFHPAVWSGAAMLSVLSISDDLTDLHPVGVMTDGQTIYASTSSLYVATQQSPDQPWNADGTARSYVPAPTTTAVHRFDIATSGPASYVGSGSIPGTILDQYSMSEQNGDLRVVSSTTPGRFVHPLPGGPIACPADAACTAPREVLPATPGEVGGAPASTTTTSPSATTTTDAAPATTTTSPSATTTTDAAASTTTTTVAPTTTTTPATTADGTLLSVLHLDGSQLTTIGRLDGLAPGEQVNAVRFVGDQAYIVTFRQYDPLFVVDLTTPSAPKLLGQLTTPGFSAYLHPIGPNLLFGVGTTIKDNEPDGSSVSLFDTSDPTHPTQVASIPFPGQGTTLDSDPHAFTWDANDQLAFVATSITDQNGNEHNGMSAYRVDGHTIRWVGFIDHSAHDRTGIASGVNCPPATYCPDIAYAPSSPADRVIVIGDRVFAASNSGVSIRPIDTMIETAWIGW